MRKHWDQENQHQNLICILNFEWQASTSFMSFACVRVRVRMFVSVLSTALVGSENSRMCNFQNEMNSVRGDRRDLL